MDLQPKLHAAADMCEAGEEVNLDELAFLLRYAADELANRPDAIRERDHLVERMRQRLLARCELLERPEHDVQHAREGNLAQLEELEAELDHALRHRLIDSDPTAPTPPATGTPAQRDLSDKFASGR
ncbi:MAG: hypothetical protein V2A56_01670 [bacterium]